MSVRPHEGFVSYAPITRDRRARRNRVAAVAVIAAVASSTFFLQAFYDGQRAQAAGAPPAAFAYFPN